MKIKIPSHKLRKDMFVCELDRPWLETPFSIQGFYINSIEQIEEVKKYCEDVYVDTIYSSESVAIYLSAYTVNDKDVYLGEVEYENSSNIEEELDQAKIIRNESTNMIVDILDNLKSDREIDMGNIKSTIVNMAESIIREPNALVLLVQLRHKDPLIYCHAINVCTYMLAFGRHLGYPHEQLIILGIAGLLLDIGKIKLPQELNHVDHKLTKKEVELFRTHVNESVEILSNTPDFPQEALHIITNHHERLDGSGYPSGLCGNEIDIMSGMISIVDYYDLLTLRIENKASISPFRALQDIYSKSGSYFKPELVEQFIQCIGIYPVGSLIELNTGEVAIVIEQNKLRRLKPKVMIILDKKKQPTSNVILNLLHEPKTNNNTIYEIKRAVESNSFNVDLSNYYL